MFDLIFDNPVVGFFVLYAIYRFFKGKKSDAVATAAAKSQVVAKAQAAADEARLRATQRKVASIGTSPGSDVQSGSAAPSSLEQRLSDAVRQFELKLSPEPTVAPPAEPHVMLADQPRTFYTAERFSDRQTVSSLDEKALDRGSYDETGATELVIERSMSTEGVDYDAREKAFEFHTASDEPTAKAFHLDSFAGFHSATGVRTATAEVESIESEESLIESLFGSNAADMQRAIILNEVLARPLSVRRRERMASRPR